MEVLTPGQIKGVRDVPGESKNGQGFGSGCGEPGRIEEVGISFDNGICWEFDLTECGRLAINPLVHACAGNQVAFSKVPG